MDHNKAKKAARILAIVLAVALILTSLSFVMYIPGFAEAGGYAIHGATGQENSESYLKQRMTSLETMVKVIQEGYKDEVTYKTLMDGAFNGIFEALEDPYSVYYSSVEEGDEFVDSATGVFGGIGVSMEIRNGQCTVVTPLSGTPAEAAGIRTGDVVTKVDGIDVKEKELSEISALLKGTPGTKVAVTVERGGKAFNFTMVRAKIQDFTVKHAMLEGKIGYIRITQFGETTHTEFQTARLQLLNQGAQSLILDLRSNPGGLMDVAANIAGQLMTKAGPIYHYSYRGEIVETISAKGSATKALPMVLLINEGSGSASEMLAGALQDSKTATLVGTTTYGKGVAQQYAELKDGTAFKLSMFYFLTPDKHQINHVGISPDYEVYNGLGLSEEEIYEVYGSLAPMTEKVKYKAGEMGLNVYAAQQRLEYLGYDLVVNGTMDGKTVEAVKKFQAGHKLSPYGVLDYVTMDGIDQAFYSLISGADGDLQLEKAIQLLKK